MRDSLPLALGRTRARLNAVIALHRALAWAAPTAAVSGLLVAAARALGLDAGGFALWAALSVAGAAAGAFASRSSFLDEAGAARWLDSRLDDDELLASALACLNRGAEGRFDAFLAAKAEALLPRALRVRASRRSLAKQGAKALAALAIGAYLVFLSGMTTSWGGATARARTEAARASASKPATAQEALEEGGKAAAEFAASLFPNDRRMATLTERALREGRLDDLRELLKAAGLDVDAKLAGRVAESERKKLAREREKLGDAETALALAAKSRSAREGGSSQEDGKAGTDGSRGQYPPGMHPNGDQGPGQGGGSGRSSDGRDKSPGADGAGGSAGESSGAEAGEGGEGRAGKAGSGYGKGSGTQGDWGDVEPLRGKGSLDIAAPKNPNFFELVLPGSDASQPVSNLVPSSRKSAEAAMSREGLPLEYEDSVRSYYLQLSKGESR